MPGESIDFSGGTSLERYVILSLYPVNLPYLRLLRGVLAVVTTPEAWFSEAESKNRG